MLQFLLDLQAERNDKAMITYLKLLPTQNCTFCTGPQNLPPFGHQMKSASEKFGNLELRFLEILSSIPVPHNKITSNDRNTRHQKSGINTLGFSGSLKIISFTKVWDLKVTKD